MLTYKDIETIDSRLTVMKKELADMATTIPAPKHKGDFYQVLNIDLLAIVDYINGVLDDIKQWSDR